MRHRLLLIVIASLAPACVGQNRYWNETWNFCVNHPAGWSAHHPVDEYAIEFTRGASVSMSFGAIKDNESLEDNFRSAYLTGDARILGRQDTRFLGRSAIVATVIGDGTPMKVHRIMTVADDKKGVIYEFQLTAPDLKTLERYLPKFNSEQESFKFNCK